MKQRTHWTVSALKDFETCPAKYEWSYLFEAADWRKLGYKVVPAKDSPAMARGTEIHETCEDYLLGKITFAELHREIPPAWRHLIKGLKDIGAIAEQQWEADADWNPVAITSGPLWLRLKIDAHYWPTKRTLCLIDYKTGKPYLANMEQLEVYALAAFGRFDHADSVLAELWYLDHEEPNERTITRDQAPKLAAKWEQRAAKLLEAKAFPSRPNKFCNWCPYSQKKGGPCRAA